MKWMLNFWIRLLGAFLTSFGLFGLVSGKYVSPGWVVGFLTFGLTLLFIPEIKK